MRIIVSITLITIILFIGCSNPSKELVIVKNDYEIDITDIDSVHQHLNGFWIKEVDKNAKEILWLDFDKNKNRAF